MDRLPLVSTSKRLNISPTQCRYWSKLLSLEITKEGKTAFLPAGSDSLLSEMKKAVNSGLSPSLAAKEVLSTYSANLEKPHAITKPLNDNVLVDRIATLEAAVLLLVSENQKQRELLNKRFDRIELKLEPPVQKKAFKVWTPPAPKKKHIPLLKRIYLGIFNPMALRRSAP